MKKFAILSLTMLALAGCQTATPPMSSPADHHLPASFTQCGKKNPAVTMCTMDYTPVCGKVSQNGIVSYKTYGNACSACNGSDNVISYTKGACDSNTSNTSR